MCVRKCEIAELLRWRVKEIFKYQWMGESHISNSSLLLWVQNMYATHSERCRNGNASQPIVTFRFAEKFFHLQIYPLRSSNWFECMRNWVNFSQTHTQQTSVERWWYIGSRRLHILWTGNAQRKCGKFWVLYRCFFFGCLRLLHFQGKAISKITYICMWNSSFASDNSLDCCLPNPYSMWWRIAWQDVVRVCSIRSNKILNDLNHVRCTLLAGDFISTRSTHAVFRVQCDFLKRI